MDNLNNALKSFNKRYKSINVGDDKDEIIHLTYNQLCKDFNLTTDQRIDFANIITKKYSIKNKELFKESIVYLQTKIEALTTVKELLSIGIPLTEAKQKTKQLLILEGWNKKIVFDVFKK